MTPGSQGFNEDAPEVVSDLIGTFFQTGIIQTSPQFVATNTVTPADSFGIPKVSGN